MFRIELLDFLGATTKTVLFEGEFTLNGWGKGINAPKKMVFSIHKASPKATEQNLRLYGRVLLYRKGTAIWGGYIEATNLVDDRIEVLCMGTLGILKKRYTTRSCTGEGSTEAFNLLGDANGDGDTGITAGTGGVTSTKDLDFADKEVFGALEELAGAHGAEFEVDEEWKLNFVPELGTDQSAVITLTFRQDGQPGTNLRELDYGEDGEGMANEIIGVSGVMTSTQDDAASQALYGVLVERKTFNDAQDQGTLDSMTISYLTQRANPITDVRVVPVMARKRYNSVTGERVTAGLEYGDVEVGDLVSVVLITPNRTVETTKRIAEIVVDVDENLQETMRFTLSESGVFVTASMLYGNEIADLKRRLREVEALL